MDIRLIYMVLTIWGLGLIGVLLKELISKTKGKENE
jgi:hypothetical protein